MPAPAPEFRFQHRIEFEPNTAETLLRQVPALPGVFALRLSGQNSADPAAEPYLTRAADLRRRLRRLLAPPEAVDAEGRPVLSKRLNLRERVRSIEWTETGSEWESALTLYCATRAAFGAEQARKRMRLYPPYCLRVTAGHTHPRVYATNRLSQRGLAETFGPFPSRAAAERYGDAVLDLFKLRRCYEDLEVHPDHPGCAYGEMRKCLAPCKQACTADEYAAEAARVLAFFRTRGESMLGEIAAAREAASEGMDFEAAATLHRQWEKVRAAAALADELVRPVAELRALVVQEAVVQEAVVQDLSEPESFETTSFAPSAPELEPSRVSAEASTASGAPGSDPGTRAFTDVPGLLQTGPEVRPQQVALFLLEHGRLRGPQPLSTLGVRAVREQTAVGRSLFAQPLMLAAVPLDAAAGPAAAANSPEDRARAAIAALAMGAAPEPDMGELGDCLSLFRRWYYRPEKQRRGEVFLPNADGSWPLRRLLNGAARVALGPPVLADAVNREAARDALKAGKTKVIHEGRDGVERTVPVLPKRPRRAKAVLPGDIAL